MLTHEEWVNGGRYESLFARGRPTNPARDTNRRNGWNGQPLRQLVSLRVFSAPSKVLIACGASKQADIIRRTPVQPRAVRGSKGLTAVTRMRAAHDGRRSLHPTPLGNFACNLAARRVDDAAAKIAAVPPCEDVIMHDPG